MEKSFNVLMRSMVVAFGGVWVALASDFIAGSAGHENLGVQIGMAISLAGLCGAFLALAFMVFTTKL